MTGRVWRLAKPGSRERALYVQQMEAVVDVEPARGFFEDSLTAAEGSFDTSWPPPPRLED
jgi:hypothetical protein